MTFRSDAFNTTEPRKYFINECCFGDDVAKWLAEELKARGVAADEPDQEDFGWFLNFSPAAGPHTLVLGYRPGDEDAPGGWFGVLERDCGFIASIFGGRNKGVQQEAAELIHSVLTGSEKTQEVRWHRRADFDAGREEPGSPSP